MKTYGEFRKQAQTGWDDDSNDGWVEYQYGDTQTPDDSGPGEWGEDLGQGNGEGPDPDFYLINPSTLEEATNDNFLSAMNPLQYMQEHPENAWWPGKEEGAEPGANTEPVQTAVNTAGPVRSIGATNVPGMNAKQMADDAAVNANSTVGQYPTSNGTRYGRNLVGSRNVTLPGRKPGNREFKVPQGQAATVPSAPPTNPAAANPTNPTTDSRGLTPGATTGKVETTKATTGPNMTTYKDAYAKTKTQTLGTTKTAGLFGGKKDKPKPKEKIISGPGIESWDPDYKEGIPQNYQFDYQPMNDTIYNELNKHYIKLLLDAYRRSTGKELKDPEKQLKVRYGYALGRAPNVNPDIVAQLKPEDQKWLTGWDSDIHNVTPGVVADAVDHLNNGGKYVPLMWENGDEPKRTPKPLKLSV